MALTHTLGGIEIPAGMTWTDEFSWVPVVTSANYTLTGALVVESATRQAGRPITLEASDDQGWYGMTRAKLSALYALAADAGEQYTLTLADGRNFTVMFREDAIAARPLFKHEAPPESWFYVVTLKLMVI